MLSFIERDEIEKIFNRIMDENSFLMSMQDSKQNKLQRNKQHRDALRSFLNDYKEALYSVDSNQLLRVARALYRLNEGKIEGFLENLHQFQIESQHSGLYPDTKRIAVGLAIFLATAVLLTAAIMMPLLFAVIGGILLFTLVIPLIRLKPFESVEPESLLPSFYEVYNAREKGKNLYSYFAVSSFFLSHDRADNTNNMNEPNTTVQYTRNPVTNKLVTERFFLNGRKVEAEKPKLQDPYLEEDYQRLLENRVLWV